jgi:hypothetical protein
MHWYLTRLAELGLVDAQDPDLEIDVHVAQRQRLADPQASGCDQTEQCLVDHAAKVREQVPAVAL